MGIYLKRYTQDKPSLGSQIDWSHPLSKGLVGCWLMNEGGGLKVNDIARGNNGTISGALWKPSLKGIGLDFDGVDDWVNLGSFQTTDTAGTISCWIIFHTWGEKKFFWGWGSSSADVFTWNIGTRGNNDAIPTDGDAWVYIRVYSGGGAIDNTIRFYTTSITRNSLHHIVVESNGTSYSAKVDNVEQIIEIEAGANNGVWSGDITFPAGTKYTSYGSIIYQNATLGELDGEIAKVAYWNRALSVSEIQQLYQDPYQFIKTPRNRIYSYLTPAVVTGQPRSYGYLF